MCYMNGYYLHNKFVLMVVCMFYSQYLHPTYLLLPHLYKEEHIWDYLTGKFASW